MLACFASLLRLFQIRAPLNSKFFCPEGVLNRGMRRSVLELRRILSLKMLFEYQTAYEIALLSNWEPHCG